MSRGLLCSTVVAWGWPSSTAFLVHRRLRTPLKTVAIVGRPNVGKSALFNRLAGLNLSIVHDHAGVTRDRITAQCRRGPQVFEIMDTGGIGANTDDPLTEQVQTEAMPPGNMTEITAEERAKLIAWVAAGAPLD